MHFKEHFGLGASVSWGSFFADYTSRQKVRFLWVALNFGPWQLSYRWVMKRFGIRGVA